MADQRWRRERTERWRFWRKKSRFEAPAKPGSELDALHVQNELRRYGTDVAIAASVATGTPQLDFWFRTQEAAARTAEAVRIEGISADVCKAEDDVWGVLAHTHDMTDEERTAAQAKVEELARQHGPDYHGFGNPPPRTG